VRDCQPTCPPAPWRPASPCRRGSGPVLLLWSRLGTRRTVPALKRARDLPFHARWTPVPVCRTHSGAGVPPPRKSCEARKSHLEFLASKNVASPSRRRRWRLMLIPCRWERDLLSMGCGMRASIPLPRIAREPRSHSKPHRGTGAPLSPQVSPGNPFLEKRAVARVRPLAH
jgi:hypothetical protein